MTISINQHNEIQWPTNYFSIPSKSANIITLSFDTTLVNKDLILSKFLRQRKFDINYQIINNFLFIKLRPSSNGIEIENFQENYCHPNNLLSYIGNFISFPIKEKFIVTKTIDHHGEVDVKSNLSEALIRIKIYNWFNQN